ncbi:MAG: hypothetical protein ACM3XR_02400 [Bacillota bacterium]
MYNYMQKKCTFCRENIPADAGRCPYCGSVLETAADDSLKTSMEENESGKQPYAGPEGEGAHEPVQDPEAGQEIPGSISQGQPTSAKTGAAYGSQVETGPWTEQGYQYRYAPQPGYGRTPLSNGMKVFLTVLFTLLPGIGQLAGIITAVVFMGSEGDNDRKSFGTALLISNVVLFMLSCIGCFIFAIAAQSLNTLP